MTNLTGPTTQSERILSLDVLRGFAVLGILVMNIQHFSMVGAAYFNPTAYGDLTGTELRRLAPQPPFLRHEVHVDLQHAVRGWNRTHGRKDGSQRTKTRSGPLPTYGDPPPLRHGPRMADLDGGHPLLLRHVRSFWSTYSERSSPRRSSSWALFQSLLRRSSVWGVSSPCRTGSRLTWQGWLNSGPQHRSRWQPNFPRIGVDGSLKTNSGS